VDFALTGSKGDSQIGQIRRLASRLLAADSARHRGEHVETLAFRTIGVWHTTHALPPL
jgi:hypothetical protein